MYACPECDATEPNKSGLLRHLYNHHRQEMADLGKVFWPLQRPTEIRDRRLCNACRIPIQHKNWGEHVSSKHRGIYTVCPLAFNLPCGSQSRPRPVDDLSWESEKLKLEDKGWWVDEEGNHGE